MTDWHLITWQTVTVAAVLVVVLGLVLASGPGRHGFAVAGRWSWSRWRRHRWVTRIRSSWPETVRAAGLSRHTTRRERVDGRLQSVEAWEDPRLVRIRTTRHAVTLTVRTRRGQALAELETIGPRLAATYGAAAYRTYPAPGRNASVCFDLVMRDLLRSSQIVTTDRVAQLATAADDGGRLATGSVQVGRRQDGRPFWLQLRERMTLVVGCAGSGKGSFLWGICCGLGPAVWVDAVRLYGIDLKGGVELGMGERLFTRLAYDGKNAVDVLQDLNRIAETRMQAMRGNSRSFRPTPGDPFHVLIIDELATLTAYGEADVKKVAGPLLSAILSKGRAVGVLVVAFVQDPRKEAIPMRGLFTQTVALRLRSAEEVVMVLGEGMSGVAPAHRILPDAQGTAYVVAEDGSADRVRADYWPDEVIRRLADQFPAGQGRTQREVTQHV